MSQPATEDLRPMRRSLGLSAAILLFAILLFVPLPSEFAADGELLLPGPARRLLAVTVAMAVMWFTEAIPVCATAFLPLAAYPLLGIASAADASSPYVNHLTFLYFGGLVIAIAIERWQVHRRISLRVMQVVGSSPRGQMVGLLAVSAGLSMWISNTATAMLLLPIALALIDESAELSPDLDDRTRQNFAIALLLSIAYGSNCGGLATPVGTPTNAALLGFWAESPDLPGQGPSLGQWIVIALPFALLMLVITALLLGRGLPGASGQSSRDIIRERLQRLGPMCGGAKTVFGLFCLTAVLWVTRGEILAGETVVWPGWEKELEAVLRSTLGFETKGMIHDATIAMATCMLLFVLPGKRPDGEWTPLLDWDATEKRIPWGVLMLFGAGFTIAAAFESTGLDRWTGHLAEQTLAGASPIVIIGGAVTLVTFLTEFTTNVATISTLLPVLVASSVQLGMDPVLVVVPATMAASCAFMLPIATPPNAVVFGSGRVPIQRMIRTGIYLNIASIGLLTLLAMTLIPAILGR